MLIGLIATDYPPLRSSAAVQMRDLAGELLAQGHEPIVIVPGDKLPKPWVLESWQGVQVLRVAAPNIRAGGNVRRALAEALLPFAMHRGVRSSPLRDARWDAVVWYSPSIFFGPLVWLLRRRRKFSTYLILRDIFPEWTLDLGLMRKGPAYGFFKLVAALQYAQADTIGIQSPSNAAYLERWSERLEVLQNWLSPAADRGCSLQIAATPLAGRTIFVYLGNVGVAQALDIFLDVAESLRELRDIGFLFVGRGTEFARLQAAAHSRALDNLVFHSEIEPEEVPGLLAQCHVGLLALDPRHRTHNVPGKFLSYMQCGLPVLARVNPGVDLAELIRAECVGEVYVDDSSDEIARLVRHLAGAPIERQAMATRARALGARLFESERAAKQIVAALRSERSVGRRGKARL